MKRQQLLGGCMVLLGLAQLECVGRQKRAPVPVTPLGIISPDKRLARARTHVGDRQRLDAVATVRGVPGLGAMGLTVDLVAERPARLYLGARSFFGPPTDELWTDGVRYLWRSARPGAGGKGPASPEAMTALLPVPLPASQWVGLLFGLPLEQREDLTAAECPAERQVPVDRWCVVVQDPDGATAELWLLGDGAVESARVSRGGAALRVVYQERRADLAGLATVLDLEVVEGQLGTGVPRRAGLRLKDVRLNGPAPAPALFAPLEDGPLPFLDAGTVQP